MDSLRLQKFGYSKLCDVDYPKDSWSGCGTDGLHRQLVDEGVADEGVRFSNCQEVELLEWEIRGKAEAGFGCELHQTLCIRRLRLRWIRLFRGC